MLSPVKIWRNQKKIAGLIGISGQIISWTFIRVPPAEFSGLAPYPVVLVKLSDGRNLMMQLVDYDETDLKFGRKVVTVIRRVTDPNTDGIIPYYVKAKPI
jgi:uncharacterized OB-fold protein